MVNLCMLILNTSVFNLNAAKMILQFIMERTERNIVADSNFNFLSDLFGEN